MCKKIILVTVVVLTLGLVSNAIADLNDDPNLIAHWKFDEEADDIAVDSSKNGLNGNLIGDPNRVPGRINGAILFDGVDDYVDCGNNPIYNTITKQITVSCWIKVNLFDPSWQAIITKGDHSWRLSRSNLSDKLHFATSGNVLGKKDWLDGKTNVNDGNWHHVAGVNNGSNLNLYVDGVLDASWSTVTGPLKTDNFKVFIGANEESKNSRYWNGIIDDVRIYNRGLSEAEIKSLYALSSSKTN